MRDMYKEVTDSIVAQLEQGALPWLKPWQNMSAGNAADMPCNAISSRSYSGVNVFILWGESMARGYSSGRWLTFKQAKEAGGTVRKGETGTHIIFLKKIHKKATDSSGNEKDSSFSMMRTYCVFNVEQCDNLPAKVTKDKPLPPAPVLESNYIAFVESTKANIRHGGDRACYIPAIDSIHMPPVQAFKTTDSYKATTLHELSHWSGAKHRLNRDFSGRFGSESYAFEELIAEISCAFLCAHLGIAAEQRHAGYLESWLKVLKQDKKAIFTAASQASKAADHLRAYSELSGAEGDEEPESIAA